jgi:hypothetical protein
MKLKFTSASAITLNPKRHYHVHKNPSSAPNLRQTISVYISVIFIWIIFCLNFSKSISICISRHNLFSIRNIPLVVFVYLKFIFMCFAQAKRRKFLVKHTRGYDYFQLTIFLKYIFEMQL